MKIRRKVRFVRIHDIVDAGGTVLFRGFNHELAVKAQFSALFQNACQSRHMQAVLLLIVRRTATVNLVSTLFDAPRREPLIPLLFVSADDVAVTITQDCRQAVAFVTCRQQD